MRQWIFLLMFETIAVAGAEESQTGDRLKLDQAIINVLERSP